MGSMIGAIKKRYSCRTYSSSKVEEVKKQKIQEYLDTNRKGPFGNDARFQMVDATEDDINELKKLGTYGNTNGARLYIAGAVKKGEKSMEDFGYCMEKNILIATDLGLSTLWLGGSLNRSAFASKIGAAADELIPAVTPVGYPAEKRSVRDRLVTVLSSSRKRKNFGEIFFDANFSNPLNEKACGKYIEVLEAVRSAPSASNKQPWRIVKEKGKDAFHFYLKENKLYNSIFKDIKLQNMDIGIAMAHFELAASELGLQGTWRVSKPGIETGDLQYIASWEA
ncbi:MAG: nitroreductase [Clostridia bacterium]|nr:nitroreductase [Clostridia bacterium]